jgi:ATP-dependent Lhr-like helicase
MLVSPNVDARSVFSKLQVAIIDEIHAFAGDDPGWHLLAVLARITRLAGHEVQRLSLSATVGNPDALADWLAGSCTREREVFLATGKSPYMLRTRLCDHPAVQYVLG